MLFKMRYHATQALAMASANKEAQDARLKEQAISIIEKTLQPLIEKAIACGKSFVTLSMNTTDDYFPFFEQILTENGYYVIIPVLEDECSGYRGKLSVKIMWGRG